MLCDSYKLFAMYGALALTTPGLVLFVVGELRDAPIAQWAGLGFFAAGLSALISPIFFPEWWAC